MPNRWSCLVCKTLDQQSARRNLGDACFKNYSDGCETYKALLKSGIAQLVGAMECDVDCSSASTSVVAAVAALVALHAIAL